MTGCTRCDNQVLAYEEEIDLKTNTKCPAWRCVICSHRIYPPQMMLGAYADTQRTPT